MENRIQNNISFAGGGNDELHDIIVLVVKQLIRLSILPTVASDEELIIR